MSLLAGTRLSLFRLLVGLFCLVGVEGLFAVESLPLVMNSDRDRAILEDFFKLCCTEEEYGYVLYGVKPISIQRFYALDGFKIRKDLEYSKQKFANSLLVREAIPIWNSQLKAQNSFVLKATPDQNSGLAYPDIQVMFINLSLLEKTIEDNIILFRTHLNPLITAKQLSRTIAFSDKSLTEILQDNRILEGIVLGFGTHNSVVGGRLENIHADSFSKDMFPYAPKSLLLESQGDHYAYGGYYLEYAGGDVSAFRSGFPLQPGDGFSTVLDEAASIYTKEEPLPQSLMEQQPRFVFGAYKVGLSNQPMFDELVHVQDKIQKLLKCPDFLEQVLSIICGKKPVLPKTKGASESEVLMKSLDDARWKTILTNVANGFQDQKDCFLRELDLPSQSLHRIEYVGASPEVLKGLNRALTNLREAEAYFEQLLQDSALKEHQKGMLYSKTLEQGEGSPISGSDLVHIEYTVQDLSGEVLAFDRDLEIKLSQAVCGFAYGVQGMLPGETRMLYVHPAVGYGALTTFPPCAALKIKVRLLEAKHQERDVLPALTPHDFKWLLNPKFLSDIESSLENMPISAAHFYREIKSFRQRE